MKTVLKSFAVVFVLMLVGLAFVIYFSTAQPNKLNFDEVISARELAKNPYRLKEHAGMLDSSILSYQKMASEHVALYGLAGPYGLSLDQLAVVLEDSNPPDTKLPWKVYVEGPTEFTTLLGTSTNISTVRFEGYGDLPKPVPVVQSDPIPVEPPQTPAPIIRQNNETPNDPQPNDPPPLPPNPKEQPPD